MGADYKYNGANNNVENIDSETNQKRRSAEREKENQEFAQEFNDKGFNEDIQTLLSPLLVDDNKKEDGGITQNDILKIQNRVLLKYKGEDNFDLKGSLQETILGKSGPVGNTGFVFENGPKTENAKSPSDYITQSSNYSKSIFDKINPPEQFNKEEMQGIEKPDSRGDTLKDYNSVEAAPNSMKKPVAETISQVNTTLDSSKESQQQSKVESQTEKGEREILENSPDTPVINSLNKMGYIEDTSSVKKDIVEGNNILQSVGESISGTSIVSSVLQQLKGGNEITIDDFDKSQFALDSKELNLEIDEPGSLETLIGENYFNLPDKNDNSFNKQEDMNRAMDIALNKILSTNGPSFKKNNSVMIEKIRGETENIQAKYNLLKQIHTAELKQDAKFLKKDRAQLLNNKNETAKKFNERKILLQQQGVKHLGGDHKLKLLKKQHDILSNKIDSLDRKIKTGEVMQGGKLDLHKTNNEKNQENS